MASVQRTGKVVRQRVAPGSKSERKAVMLDLGKRQLILRRQGENPFKDPVLEELVGKTIRCQGEETARTLIITDWVEV
jgi:hypothetical protein